MSPRLIHVIAFTDCTLPFTLASGVFHIAILAR
ncbi:hypothetical protein NAL19_3176 [Pectobacterium sp. F1-1]|nr:hypothetical protein NAL19_3176 [Pectobacterium sp. F1-1]